MRATLLQRIRLPLSLLAMLGLVAALGACSQGAGGEAHGIHLVNKGKLTVCTHLSYKPFEFTDSSGQVVGFDVDMMHLLADNLGVKLDVVSLDWHQVTSGAAFAANKCDIAMGGATITAKRKQTLAFSDPYFKASQALLVKTNSGIHGLADLKGKQLGMQTDTTGEIYAKKNAPEYGYTPVVFQDLSLMATAVSAGKIQGAIGDNGPLAYYAANNPGVTVATSFKTGEQYGFIAAKDSDNADKLLKRLNGVLAKARKDGTYKARFKHWFGDVPANTDN